MQKILVIQTAFIGDVVLATGLLEKLHDHFPDAEIDILVRKGNESLFTSHPFLHAVLIWDKKGSKYRNLWQILRRIRSVKYDLLVNTQRFAATGILTAFSGARHTVGFDKNPFSFLFSEKIRHVISKEGNTVHEVERNHELIRALTDDTAAKPKLYPTDADTKKLASFQETPYITIAPASVWFTKQFPADQWIQFINALPPQTQVYLLGGSGDSPLCAAIRTVSTHPQVTSLAGELTFLESAALQQKAVMNYVNDSAPMHFASAVNAPVTAVYCSTLPAFGFGPLSDHRHIVEIEQPLACRPCGLHGRNACPLGHFNCAKRIQTSQLLSSLQPIVHSS